MALGNMTLTMPTTATTGTAVGCPRGVNKTLQIVNTNWSGTLTVMGSIDGTNYATITQQAFTGAAATVTVPVDFAYRTIRVDNTTDTSGTEPTLVLGWENP